MALSERTVPENQLAENMSSKRGDSSGAGAFEAKPFESFPCGVMFADVSCECSGHIGGEMGKNKIMRCFVIFGLL